jgi:hypothetical protein
MMPWEGTEYVAFLYVMAAKKRAKGCYYYMEGIGLF